MSRCSTAAQPERQPVRHTPVVALLSVLLAFASCLDARTGRVLEGQDDDGVTIGDQGPPMPESPGCPAALQQEAPAPMLGYCPNGANQSDFALPESAPALRWELDLALEGVDWAGLAAIGPEGRLYVITDQDSLLAIDDQGQQAATAWTIAFDASPNRPVLLADGRIFLTTRRGEREETRGFWLDPNGRVVGERALPADLKGPPVVGRSGQLHLAGAEDDHGQIVALRPDGTVRWRSEPVGVSYTQPFVLGADDQILWPRHFHNPDSDEPEPWLYALDPTDGSVVWRNRLARDAYRVAGPSVGRDGAIYTQLWTHGTTRATLVALEPDGTQRYRVDLPQKPWGGGSHTLALDRRGRVFVKEGESLVAFDPTGVVLWQRPAHPNIEDTLVVDVHGRLLRARGDVEMVDPLSGTAFWTADQPHHQVAHPKGGATIFVPRAPILGDGVIYYFASDTVLFALQ